MPSLDPDRFLNFSTPGAQEWWYFDAISDDGRDALVVVWYAALPFDPDYGVAAIRHRKDPARHPAPHALDHCAFGLSWYRDGKTVAYALNGFRRGDFAHRTDPFLVDVAGNRLERGPGGYRLRVETPASNGRQRISADLTFEPSPATAPLECNLGDPESPHLWIVAAADCRVEGHVARDGRRSAALAFRGRGYHDHNAGAEEISMAMRRWQWGRVHAGPTTQIYYHAEPRSGASKSLWITCREGCPEQVRERVTVFENSRRRNAFGLRFNDRLQIDDGSERLRRRNRQCVDDGPFYRRWIAGFEVETDNHHEPADPSPGICELLDTGNLNRPLFNWMIPFRLKRPDR